MTQPSPSTRLRASDLVLPRPAPDVVARLRKALTVPVSPVLAQIMVNRGLADVEAAEDFLTGDLDTLHEPEMLEGIAEAADLVAEAVRRGDPILVHGDYDADGVSGTALLVSFLRDIGAAVGFHIPHRVDEGYGLSAEGVRKGAAEGYTLLLSVDCGSSSPEVVDLARSLGMCVVITDHHMVTTPPPAHAFVNPRAPGSGYPFPHLSGVGVAYKLITALSYRLSDRMKGRTPEQYLDLVVIGTVGDVVPLVGENRVLVREGLNVMQALERPGIAALARVVGLVEEDVEARSPAGEPRGGTTEQGAEGERFDDGLTSREAAQTGARPSEALRAVSVAFGIAPRINASGRLEHAEKAAALLLETDAARAEALARELEAINERRREHEAKVRTEAEAQALARGLEGRAVIVEAGADWHPGVVGITANRLLDRHGLPALVIALLGDGTAKGSARAPASVDLYEALRRCADLFTHFGGHPRAGGFSMPAENVDILRERLETVVREMAPAPSPGLRADAEIALSSIDFGLLEELALLEPFGQGNPAPLFVARRVTVKKPRLVKDRHWSFHAVQGGVSLRCIGFGLAERLPHLEEGETCDMVFALELETYRGERRIRVAVRELLRDGHEAPSEGAVAGLAAGTGDDRSSDGALVESGQGRLAAASGGKGWRIEDARRHHSHGGYLSEVLEAGQAVVVLCRRDQVSFAQRLLAAGGDRMPANAQVIPYGEEALRRTSAAHWVLFTPPPSVAALQPLVGKGGCCHVLFSPDELDRDAALIDAVTLPRERLEQIFRIFRQGLDEEGVLDESRFSSLLEAAGAPELRPESLRAALRVLTEIGVLAPVDGRGGCHRITGTRRPLEESKTWPRYRDLAAEFTPMRALFSREEAEMREGLLSILSGG